MPLEEVLDAAVKEIAGLKLSKVRGFLVCIPNRAFLVGLLPGAWFANATRSLERNEVAQEIVNGILTAVLPVLQRHLPGRRWRYEWVRDHDGCFGNDDGTVISVRWEE